MDRQVNSNASTSVMKEVISIVRNNNADAKTVAASESPAEESR